MGARRLEQVERAVGVDREVGLRLARRPVVGGLRGGVDDQLDPAGVLAEDPLDRRRRRGCRLSPSGTPDARRPSRSVTWEVDDSGPKKRARMSFSMPTTSKPSATKCSTASEPISPPEPVMIATGIRAYSPCPPGHRCSGRSAIRSSSARIHSSMSARILSGSRCGRQSVSSKSMRAIRNVNRHVTGPRLRDRLDRNLVAGQLAADLGRLKQREAALASAAHVCGAPVPVPQDRAAGARPGRPGHRCAGGREPACRRRRSRCS